MQSEKYLLVDNGWTLSGKLFPHFGHLQSAVLYGSVIGFMVVARVVLSFLKKLKPRMPHTGIPRHISLPLSAVVIISSILGLILGLCEWDLSRKHVGCDILLAK